jgi:hypothetical protein
MTFEVRIGSHASHCTKLPNKRYRRISWADDEIQGAKKENGNMHDNIASAPHQGAKPGDILTFGIYPQRVDGTDRTPIKWRVLQNTSKELFVLSEYILDCKRYHAENVDTTWRDCDLRKWLNNEFYNAAFNAAEKRLIKTTHCTDNGAGSPDTKDKVFLLGVTEVTSLTNTLGKDFRRAIGTEFAKVKKSDGCHLYVYDKNVEADYITENGQKQGCSWWWLRTQLHESSARAAFVGPRCSIRSYARVNLARDGVRSALKLKLT